MILKEIDKYLKCDFQILCFTNVLKEGSIL